MGMQKAEATSLDRKDLLFRKTYCSPTYEKSGVDCVRKVEK
jgi:hypothetical protein